MFETGRVCIKTAGRDSGLHSVIVEVIDANTLLVDNESRRKKCAILHLQPTEHVLDIEQGASRESVLSLLQEHLQKNSGESNVTRRV